MQRLPLDIFTDLSSLYEKGFFEGGSCLDFLGKTLQERLFLLLKQKGVVDSPVIKGKVSPLAVLEGAVFVDEGAVVEPFAMITGPTFIGRDSEVRHGAYLRGSVYVGRECVVGHTTEVKGSVFCDGAKAGHFAYVGDSWLGRDVNLGAGTKLANLKLRANEISVRLPVSLGGEKMKTGLRKFGGILGDRVQTGCNSVISPGSLLLPDTHVMSCVHFHGTLEKGIAR